MSAFSEAMAARVLELKRELTVTRDRLRTAQRRVERQEYQIAALRREQRALVKKLRRYDLLTRDQERCNGNATGPTAPSVVGAPSAQKE